MKDDITPGQVYKVRREEIVGPKPKYHLYLSNDIVFLINSDKNYYEFNFPLSKDDCPILTKDCYLQLTTLYKLDEKQPVITMADMSDDTLIRLNSYLKDTTLKKAIPRMFVQRAIGIIEQCLTDRKNTSTSFHSKP